VVVHPSSIQKEEREEEKEKVKFQSQQSKFYLNIVQQPRFIFLANIPPLTSPNSSISDSINLTQFQTKYYQKDKFCYNSLLGLIHSFGINSFFSSLRIVFYFTKLI
jgi:hypothetical protein